MKMFFPHINLLYVALYPHIMKPLSVFSSSFSTRFCTGQTSRTLKLQPVQGNTPRIWKERMKRLDFSLPLSLPFPSPVVPARRVFICLNFVVNNYSNTYPYEHTRSLPPAALAPCTRAWRSSYSLTPIQTQPRPYSVLVTHRLTANSPLIRNPT
jgi:hypothetical protein